MNDRTAKKPGTPGFFIGQMLISEAD